MVLPVSSGRITQVFGPTNERRDTGGINKGLDISVPSGTPVMAVVDGVVVAAGDLGDGWGTSIKVRDANGYIHNYGHLSKAGVAVGSTISAGQVIASSGNTGASTGPHLSYDVKDPNGQYVDPSPWLGFSAAGDNRSGHPAIGQDVSTFAGGGGAMTQPEDYNPFNLPDPAEGGGNLQDIIGNLNTWLQFQIANPPTQEDYPDADEFSLAQQDWLSNLATIQATMRSFQEQQYGFVTLGDGTTVPVGEVAPELAQAITNANLENYRLIQNDFKLDQYDLETGRLNQDFINKLNQFDRRMSIEDLNATSADAAIDRQLSGLEESRQRAEFVTNKNMELAPWATGGKTDFSGNDLGSIFSAWGGLGGLDPSKPFIRYPGSMNIDPAGILSMFDEQLGVTGQLPGAYTPSTGFQDIPAAPALPAAPDLIPPGLPPPTSGTAPGGGGVTQVHVPSTWDILDTFQSAAPGAGAAAGYSDFSPGNPFEPWGATNMANNTSVRRNPILDIFSSPTPAGSGPSWVERANEARKRPAVDIFELFNIPVSWRR